jgi:hypothetical protein
MSGIGDNIASHSCGLDGVLPALVKRRGIAGLGVVVKSTVTPLHDGGIVSHCSNPLSFSKINTSAVGRVSKAALGREVVGAQVIAIPKGGAVASASTLKTRGAEWGFHHFFSLLAGSFSLPNTDVISLFVTKEKQKSTYDENKFGRSS